MSELVGSMFNRIAPRYDLANRMLSFGQDVLWRRKVAALARGRSVLDLATGTGDLLFEVVKQKPEITRAIGMDIAQDMLGIARRKIPLPPFVKGEIYFQEGDAMAAPFGDQAFDVVTIGFGIRNCLDPNQVLREMYRVLTPSGRAIVLEFSLPAKGIFRALFLLYLRYVLPWLGGLISGDLAAYRYLNKTIEAFAYGEKFANMMRQAGFQNVQVMPLTFGVATIYCGERMGS